MLAAAFGARGVNWNVATPTLGLPSAKKWTALTWSASVMGLSTSKFNGTTSPFSAIDGRSSLILPGVSFLSP